MENYHAALVADAAAGPCPACVSTRSQGCLTQVWRAYVLYIQAYIALIYPQLDTEDTLKQMPRAGADWACRLQACEDTTHASTTATREPYCHT